MDRRRRRHRLPSPRGLAALPLALLLLAAAGCGEEEAPVARLDVQPATVSLPHGTYADLELAWTPVAELAGAAGAPRVFLHLLDDDDQVVRTFDHELPGDWVVGEELRYPARVYQSLLAPPLPAGSYRLTAGLHDAAGTRWPLETSGEGKRQEYPVATIEVPDAPATLPTVGFSDAWSPTMAGGDRQVVAYRWLTGDGVVRIAEAGGRSTLWLDLEIPKEGEGNMRRVYRGAEEPPAADAVAGPGAGGEAGAGPAAPPATDGAMPEGAASEVPTVVVSTDCGDFSATRSGAGPHRVEVPVEAGGAGCTVELSPNFFMLQPGAGRRSLLLQNAAWKGGG